LYVKKGPVWYTAISIKVVPKQSGKVEYGCERLAGNRKKINEFINDSQQAFRARIRLFRFARDNLKDDFHSVLPISSAHNKGGPPDIKILHLSNFFELKRTVYIHLQA
jgi:hypothetical protein